MNMETFREILKTLLYLVVTSAVPVLVKYITEALDSWAESKTAEIDNEIVRNCLEEINEIIYQAVVSTTQTYVDSLKAQGKFDVDAQITAFEDTKTVILDLLSTESKDFIRTMYGDLDLWLDTKIEQYVNESKRLR